jgi:3-methyladenine DNA glycosylase AlkD
LRKGAHLLDHAAQSHASTRSAAPYRLQDQPHVGGLDLIDRHVADREWFIQKAIGWWLRELSRRNPKRVRRFLNEHREAARRCQARSTKYLKA